jgi:hypothetical protein
VVGIALPLLRDDGGLEVGRHGGRLAGLRGGDGGAGRERATPAPIASHLKDTIRPPLRLKDTTRRATAPGEAPET